MMNAIAFIFARGGSKGLPGKNIMNLDGKPLIGWAIEHAKSIPQLQRIIVSTDSEEIADIARYFGAEAPFEETTRIVARQFTRVVGVETCSELLVRNRGTAS